MASLLRKDILANYKPDPTIIVSDMQFSQVLEHCHRDFSRSRTPFPAKNLNEFYALVGQVVTDFETRENTIDDGKIFYTEEEPDFPAEPKVIISFSLVRREPGSFAQGHPFEHDHASVKNLVPILREEKEDPENPGYKTAVLGYWHDNEVKFTIWARTNKVANDKALWFEGIMQEYSWYFTSQGIARCIFIKREKDFVSQISGIKMYARPIHYYVKTETLRTLSQKKIELIEIKSKQENKSLLIDPQEEK